MNLKEYQKESSRTFAGKLNTGILDDSFNKLVDQMDLLHCGVGAATEVGELLDAMKKSIYYNKPLDIVNIGEEIADTMWYLSNLCRILGLDMEKLLDNNINKLRVRYPEKFTKEDAITRNLEAERKELEK